MTLLMLLGNLFNIIIMCQNCWCDCNCQEVIPTIPACPCEDTPLPISIVSPENTIGITHIGEEGGFDVREIEKPCCDDIFVAVNEDDPGNYLENQIVADDTGFIDWSVDIWPDWTPVLKPVIDFDVLPDSDALVAASVECEPWYLEDVVGSESSYFDWNTDDCKVNIAPKPRTLLRAQITCTIEQWYTLTPNTTSRSAIQSNRTEWSSSIPSALWTITIGWLTYETITIPKDWWYLVSFQGSYVSSWVHTIRNQVWTLDGTNIDRLILDARDEGGWRVDDDDNNLINTQTELNTDIAKALHDDILTAGGMEMALSTFNRGHNFGWSRLIELTQGTVLMCGFKYNTQVKNTFTDAIEQTVVFTREGSEDSTNGEWAGTTWSVAEMPLYTLCD